MIAKKEKDEKLKRINQALKDFLKAIKNQRKQYQKEAELRGVVTFMEEAGLPISFILKAFHLAFRSNPIHKLMKMWIKETDSRKRNKIVASIQELI